jgi:hypothetical protein
MRLSLVVSVLVAACLVALAQQASPRMVSAEPQNAKRGDVITIAGENLAKDIVAKVFLTDDKTDIQVEVTEQTATAIKFKIPVKAIAGRLSIMVETAGKDRKQIVQPVKVTVEE